MVSSDFDLIHAAKEPARPPEPRVRWWHLVLPLIAGVAGVALIAFLGGLVAGYYGVKTQREITNLLTQPGIQYIVLQSVLAVVYLFALIALSRLLGRIGKTKMIADFSPVRGRWIALGALSGVAMVLGVAAIGAALEAYGIEFKHGEAEKMVMPHSGGELLMAVGTIVILGPFFEELYFRGALMTWLTGKIGLIAAILIGSILFALAHGQFVAFPGAQGWIATGLLALVGVINSVWAWRTGSLWPPFAAHAAFNGSMVALALVAPETT